MAYTVIQAREYADTTSPSFPATISDEMDIRPARALEQQLDARLKDDKSTFNNDIAGILDE